MVDATIDETSSLPVLPSDDKQQQQKSSPS
jgi:hypothetical protein